MKYTGDVIKKYKKYKIKMKCYIYKKYLNFQISFLIKKKKREIYKKNIKKKSEDSELKSTVKNKHFENHTFLLLINVVGLGFLLLLYIGLGVPHISISPSLFENHHVSSQVDFL